LLNRNVTAVAISTNKGNSLVLHIKMTLTREMIGKLKTKSRKRRSSREVMKSKVKVKMI
jgi:hypothetical protein